MATIVGFAGNFAPRNWSTCSGQLLAISQNSALFSLLGTTYGGDGRTSFGLPDLRGRVAVGAGNGPGLSNYRLGQRGGVETVTLNVLQIPSHTHSAHQQYSNAGAQNDPKDGYPAPVGQPIWGNVAKGSMGTATVGLNGGSQWHENRSPYLAIYMVICMFGTFPSRN